MVTQNSAVVRWAIAVDARRTVGGDPIVGARRPFDRDVVSACDDVAVERRLFDNTDASPLPQIDNKPAMANRTMPASLGDMVGAFKSMVTTKINRARNGTGGLVWQRGYHERVIRHERELAAVRQYILDNPTRWAEDPNNVRS
jgi:hypothetical protein